MSQEPNQHSQEKHYVDHENADSIHKGHVHMYDFADIHKGVVCCGDLV